MRQAITIGFPHDKREGEVIIHGTDVGVDVQRKNFKKMRGQPYHPDFSKVMVFEFSRGDVPTTEFKIRPEKEPKTTPPPTPPPAAPKPVTPETKTKKG